jgi:hypothetical protein
MATNLKFYADSALTQPLTELPVNHDFGGETANSITVYLGSTFSAFQYQNNLNPGVDDLEITIVPRLTAWSAAEAVIVNDVREIREHEYKCTAISGGGVTGGSLPTPPDYPDFTADHVMTDNEVTWTYQNKAVVAATNCKLALSEAGLASATGGAALTLSDTILGGAANAVPIYIALGAVGGEGDNPIGVYNDISLSVANVVELPV